MASDINYQLAPLPLHSNYTKSTLKRAKTVWNEPETHEIIDTNECKKETFRNGFKDSLKIYD